MLALFRMIPITKGSIIIDGVDIMDIRIKCTFALSLIHVALIPLCFNSCPGIAPKDNYSSSRSNSFQYIDPRKLGPLRGPQGQ